MRDMIVRLGLAGLAATAAATAIVAAGAAAPASNATGPAGGAAPTALQSPADVARGRALFTGTCGAYCHRPTTASAAGPASDAPSLFDCTWIHGGTDAQIFNTISHGVDGTRMVAFGGAIPDEDIWRIIGYLKSASQCRTS